MSDGEDWEEIEYFEREDAVQNEIGAVRVEALGDPDDDTLYTLDASIQRWSKLVQRIHNERLNGKNIAGPAIQILASKAQLKFLAEICHKIPERGEKLSVSE
eukprot:gene20002-1030_t